MDEGEEAAAITAGTAAAKAAERCLQLDQPGSALAWSVLKGEMQGQHALAVKHFVGCASRGMCEGAFGGGVPHTQR